MPLTDVQRERVADYAALEDREDEPVFVGREDLFALVEKAVRMVGKGKGKGRTICIAGPPGIGKTAFLSELEARSAKPERIGETGMVCLKIPFAAFSSTEKLSVRIEEALPGGWRPPRKPIAYLLDKLGGGSVRVPGGFGASERKASGAAGAMFPWGAMPEMLKRVPPSLVVCLYVDEAHGLQPSEGLPDGAARNIAVGDLHEGAPPHLPALGRRLFGVFAGHTHTPEVLEKSISGRFAGESRQYMRGLSEDESLRYVNGILDHLGVSSMDPGRTALAEWIVGECGGFPHHLRNAMGAVAEGLLRTGGLALSGLDGDFVSERLRLRRTDYYEVRTEGAVSAALPQIGALLTSWSQRTEPVSKTQGRQALSALIAGLPDEARADMDREIGDKVELSGSSLMREMIHRGAVMPDPRYGCRCPIDSLAAWMETGRHAFRKPFPSLAEPKAGTGMGGPSP